MSRDVFFANSPQALYLKEVGQQSHASIIEDVPTSMHSAGTARQTDDDDPADEHPPSDCVVGLLSLYRRVSKKPNATLEIHRRFADNSSRWRRLRDSCSQLWWFWPLCLSLTVVTVALIVLRGASVNVGVLTMLLISSVLLLAIITGVRSSFLRSSEEEDSSSSSSRELRVASNFFRSANVLSRELRHGLQDLIEARMASKGFRVCSSRAVPHVHSAATLNGDDHDARPMVFRYRVMLSEMVRLLVDLKKTFASLRVFATRQLSSLSSTPLLVHEIDVWAESIDFPLSEHLEQHQAQYQLATLKRLKNSVIQGIPQLLLLFIKVCCVTPFDDDSLVAMLSQLTDAVVRCSDRISYARRSCLDVAAPLSSSGVDELCPAPRLSEIYFQLRTMSALVLSQRLDVIPRELQRLTELVQVVLAETESSALETGVDSSTHSLADSEEVVGDLDADVKPSSMSLEEILELQMSRQFETGPLVVGDSEDQEDIPHPARKKKPREERIKEMKERQRVAAERRAQRKHIQTLVGELNEVLEYRKSKRV